MNEWHPGPVALDDFGPIDAHIHTNRWNGFARARFARPEAEQAVAYFHEQHQRHAEAGQLDMGEDMFWDPRDPDSIIVVAYDHEPSRIRPDQDGMWTIEATWRLSQPDWPDQDATLAKLCGDDNVRAMARTLRLTTERARAADPAEDDAAWMAASADRQRAARRLWAALIDAGVPIGHTDAATGAIYRAAARTLPHTGIVAPLPCPQVVGIDYLETSRGVAFVAKVVLNGKPYGVIENDGNGGATTFTPTDTQEYGTRRREMERFAAACTHPDTELCDEDVYNALLDEYERAEQTARFPSTGSRTLIRVPNDIDYQYVVIPRRPATMPRTLHTSLTPEAGKLIASSGRCEYWDGRHRWHHVTVIEQP